MKLHKNDLIITAYAEYTSGPGWANCPIWVIVQNHLSSELGIECIQPQERTAELTYLFDVSNAINKAMTNAVISWRNKQMEEKIYEQTTDN